MTGIVNWLRDRAPGFGHLTAAEVEAISEFSLLWPLFEARVLDTRGCASAICGAVKGWSEQGTLDACSLDAELAYFRQRYYAEGTFTHRFFNLHLKKQDRENLVRSVIEGSNDDPVDRVATILIIVLRYRNNLFHGVKWQYQLAGQIDNFRTANAILVKVLERHGALDQG